MSNQKHSEEFIQQVADMAERGVTRGQIAKEMHITRGVVSGILMRYYKRAGATQKKKQLSSGEIDQIRAFAADGLSMSQIGEKIGRSGPTVAHLCRKHGIRTDRAAASGDRRQRPTLPPRPSYTLPRKGDGADMRAQAELGLKCLPVYVDDLDNAMCVCRWPVADGLYCGERKAKYDGKPYCQEHHKIAYTGQRKATSKEDLDRRSGSMAAGKHKLSRFEFVRKYVA